MLDLSLIIPALNEEVRLRQSLPLVRSYLSAQRLRAEVIVVDDGSTDGTAALVTELTQSWPELRLVRHARNLGKGAAVKSGISASGGHLVAYADADLAAPIEQLTALLGDLRDCDVAIASRALSGAQLQRRQSMVREAFGKLYARLAEALVLRGVPDAQCGLKAYRGSAAHEIFRATGEDGILFDTEALAIAAKRNMRISQRSIRWSHDPDSRIRLGLRGALDVAVGLIRIKVRHRLLRRATVQGPIHSDRPMPKTIQAHAVSEAEA